MKIKKIVKNLELSNQNGLSFFFVGTGSAFSKINYQSNLLIIKGKDHVLVDCGTGCPFALNEYGLSVLDIENVLITHSHADHIGGLEEMAFLNRYVKRQRPVMIIEDAYKKMLWNNSLKGGIGYSEKPVLKFDDVFIQQKPKLISKKPRPLLETNVGNINLKIFRTKHIPNDVLSWREAFYSVGVLVDERILFTGDTQFDSELLDWMNASYKIEYIFHDCQFFPGGVHADYGDLKLLSPDVKSKIILCHYTDNFKKIDAKADDFFGFAERGVFYNFDE